MLFLGQAEATIDAKQRLAIPSKYRQRLPDSDTPPIWVAVPWPDGMLIRLYPEAAFERLAEALDDSLTPDEDVVARDVSLFSLAEAIESDAAGRVRLPKRHMDMVGLSQQVTVIGVRTRLEIRDRAGWEQGDARRFEELPSLVRRIEQRKRESKA